ncbi:MAG: hypothetical protein ACFFD4_26880 [Candidatus Odinarchaeota archaeon]
MVSTRRILFPGLLPSFLKIRWYRWFTGAKIGKGTKISFFSYIRSPKVTIGDNCRIGPFTFIEASHELKLGNRVSIQMLTNIRTRIIEIDDDSEIMDNVRIGGIHTQHSRLKIGKHVGIFPYAYINPSHEIILEDGVGIGGRCHLFTHGVWPSKLDGFPMKYAPIHLEKNVWLAWRVSILPGVTVGENSILQSDAFVSKNVPPNSIVSGNPSKISELRIIKYENKDKINILKDILTDLKEYREDNGEQTSDWVEEEEYFSFKTLHKKKNHVLFLAYLSDSAGKLNELLRSPDNRCKHHNIVLFQLNALQEVLGEFRSKKYSYFDLKEKRIHSTLNSEMEEFREFFKRFGVNFNFDEKKS